MESCSVCLSEIHCCHSKKINIPIITIEDTDIQEKKVYVLPDSKLKLSCGHIFHNGCIMTWLEEHNTCPLCRNKILIINKFKNEIQRPIRYRFSGNKCKYFKINNEIINNVYGQLINQSPIGYVENEPIYCIIGEKDEYYINYYLRQIIMTSNIDYGTISYYEDYLGRKIYYSDQDIEKDRLNKYRFDIMYNWVYDVMNCFVILYGIEYLPEYNSLIMDLSIVIIKNFRLQKTKFQTAIIVAIYNMITICKCNNVSMEELIKLTCNSTLKEDFIKYNNYIKKEYLKSYSAIEK